MESCLVAQGAISVASLASETCSVELVADASADDDIDEDRERDVEGNRKAEKGDGDLDGGDLGEGGFEFLL